jgi:hypothetical protein
LQQVLSSKREMEDDLDVQKEQLLALIKDATVKVNKHDFQVEQGRINLARSVTNKDKEVDAKLNEIKEC